MLGELNKKKSLDDFKNNNLGISQKISLFLFFIVAFNLDIRTQIVWWGAHGLLFISLIILLIRTNYKINKNTLHFIIWYLIFVIYALLSIQWAINIDFSI